MQDRDFDQLFKQRFEDLKVQPSTSSWEKITKELDGAGKKRKTFSSFWMAAASVILLASAILWLYKPVDVIKLQGRPDGQVAVIEKQVTNDSQVKADVVDEANEIKAVTTVPVSPKRLVASRKADKTGNQASKFKTIAVDEKKVVPLQNQVLLAKEEIQLKPNDALPVLKVEDNPAVLALLNNDLEERSTDEEVSKPRIKSIGGLVNFVIAQVDKRDDKIIEFKDGQEGSHVSGINLGPLKFKSRK